MNMINDEYIVNMMKEASKAAQKAHDECVPNPVAFQTADSLTGGFDYDKPYTVEQEGNCGGAYITTPTMRNKIAKRCKQLGYVSGDHYIGYKVKVKYDHNGSQSADRAEAAMEAASEVLKNHGLPNYVNAYLT